MKRHFFLDKTATIIEGSKANTGLNPILSLNYGTVLSRGLMHFDEHEIIDDWIIRDGIDISRVKFTLHLTNCFSVDNVLFEKELASTPGGIAKRASSFKLDLFKLQQDFDAGRGYDYSSEMWITNKQSYSEKGATWFNATSAKKWKSTGAFSESNVIGECNFDFGNENIAIDITEYIQSIANGEMNHGLGLKFSDDLEAMTSEHFYVGFFTNNTNTYFHPFIEAEYDCIDDSREHFINGANNRLYLYATSNGDRINLDAMPKCEINGKSYPVKKYSNGIYYAEVSGSVTTSKTDVIVYDVWSNIIVDGVSLDDVELEFVAHPSHMIATVGSTSSYHKVDTVPVVYGINDDEVVLRGDVRELTVDFRRKYSTDKKEIDHNSLYRLYIKDGRREFTLMEGAVEHAFLNNFIVINTNDLIPHEYFIDIKTSCGNETKIHKEVLRFKVGSNITERYY